MIIYYYCSYDGSPTGFHIGSINALEPQRNLKKIKDKSGRFIERCFESGLVRSGFGVIPRKNPEDQPTYYIIKKKLRHKKEDCNYYINIAVTTDKWGEFEKLMEGNTSEEELTINIMKSIELEKSNDFGYCINFETIPTIVNTSFRGVCNVKNDDWINNVKNKKTMYFMLSTSTPDLELLKSNLHLTSEKKEFVLLNDETGRMVCYQKKEIANRGKVFLFLLALLIIMIIIIVIAIMI